MTLTSASSTSRTVTGEPYAAVATRLRATFATGRTRSYEWRVAQLRGLDRLLTERKANIQQALGEDLRRTPFETTLFDISATRGEVKHALKHLGRWMKPRRVHAPVSVRDRGCGDGGRCTAPDSGDARAGRQVPGDRHAFR